jgi:predicted RND superfamily exporter protein
VPIGVGLAFCNTVLLLPALIAIFPLSSPPARGRRMGTWAGRVLARIADYSCGRPGTILTIALLVTVVSAAGMTRLRFSQNGLKWFREGAPVRRAAELIDDKLRGTLTIEVVVDSGRVNGLHEPDFLHQLERSVRHVESLDTGVVYVGKATSLDTVVKEIHRALNEDRPAFYTIPDSRQLVAQELLLFEASGSDDLEELVDADFSTVRCSLKVPFRDAFHYVDLIDEVAEHFTTSFPAAQITVTGSNVLYVKMFDNIISTMAKSYVISMSVITVLMMALIGRVRIGALSMVPNLLPLVAILGFMGWLDIPLDMSTVLIGSIAIGLVVDDTIHFMHNFRRYYEASGSVRLAAAETLDTAGRAIFVTSVVLAGGFYLGMVGELRSSVIYSALIGTTVLFALIADYFVTPALMAVVHRQWAAGMVRADSELEGGRAS